MTGQSPSSSPRLPSPPPIAEDQIGPTSPGVSLFEEHGLGKFATSGAVDTGAARRIRPGTKAEDMAEGPPLVALQEIDSAFPLTEHLKALHYSHTHPPDSHTLAPITAGIAKELAQPPANTGKEIWLYELGRFLVQKTNSIIVALFADSPSCSPQTCPEMRASEWQYLCAVHDPPKSCSAIDYCCHTLDWAATTLTSSKMFPSRLGLGSGGVGGGSDKVLIQQMKEITNIFRRVYRIYAHAWFQHRDMFWRVEGKTGLYVLFKTVCDEYGLIQTENYTIPPEAEGLEPDAPEFAQEAQPPMGLLKRAESDEAALELSNTQVKKDGAAHQEPGKSSVLAAGDATKRHRHTMSDRVSSVTTVIQEVEEEEEEGGGGGEGDSGSGTTEEIAPSEGDMTISKSSPPEEGTVEEAEEGEEDAAKGALGIRRSGTLRPSTPKDTDVKQEDDEGDTTIVEAVPSGSETVAESTTAAVEAKEESEDAKIIPEAPAAEGEEAEKSVED